MSLTMTAADRLDQLRVSIREELTSMASVFESARQYDRQAFSHAIVAGHALIEAKSLVPVGEWTEWLAASVDMHHVSVVRYMRIAENEELLRRERVDTVTEAIELLRHRGLTQRTKLSAEDRAEIASRALTEPASALALEYGVALKTVYGCRNRPLQAEGRTHHRSARAIKITDNMVERLAEWMMQKWGKGRPVNDQARALAREALSVALGPKEGDVDGRIARMAD